MSVLGKHNVLLWNEDGFPTGNMDWRMFHLAAEMPLLSFPNSSLASCQQVQDWQVAFRTAHNSVSEFADCIRKDLSHGLFRRFDVNLAFRADKVTSSPIKLRDLLMSMTPQICKLKDSWTFSFKFVRSPADGET